MGAVGAYTTIMGPGAGDEVEDAEKIDPIAVILIGVGMLSTILIITYIDYYPELATKASFMALMMALAFGARTFLWMMGGNPIVFIRSMNGTYVTNILMGGLVTALSAGVLWMVFIAGRITAAGLTTADAWVQLLFYCLAGISEEVFWIFVVLGGSASLFHRKTIMGIEVPGLMIGFFVSMLGFPIYHLAVYGTQPDALWAVLIYRACLNASYLLSGRILSIPIIAHVSINVIAVIQGAVTVVK